VGTAGLEPRPLGRTDENGWLRADAAGLPPIVRVVVQADGYGEESALARAPGEVTVRLLPQTRASGRVVERGTAKPVAGLTVTCDRQETTSATDGTFALSGISPGRRRIEARGEGWAGAQSEPFSLGPADSVRDLVVEVSPAFALAGRVLAEGRPVPGAEVELRTPDGFERSVKSDDDGRYCHTGLAPGSYQVVVRGDAVMTTIRDALVAIVDRDVTLDFELGHRERLAFQVVDGAGRPLAGIAVHVAQIHDAIRASTGCRTDAAGACAVTQLWPGLAEIGTRSLPDRPIELPTQAPVRLVVDDIGSLHGQLVRSDGRPVPERWVVSYRDGGSGHGTAHSDDQGRFRMTELPAGRYQVEVYLRNGISQHTPREAAVEVTIEGGQTTEVTIPVVSASAPIAGTVVDEAGRPVPDALVTYDHFDPGLVTSDTFARGLALTTTDERGAFQFADVLDHYRYTVTAQTRAGRLGTLEDLKPGTTNAVVRVQHLADLTVEVIGFAASHVTVDLKRGQQTEQFRFGAGNGALYHFDSLRPGPVVVTAESSDGRAEAAVLLEPGRPASVRVGPPPPAPRR
jgi:protocatechuate 3,4-dioxygenase beta subunit